MPIYDNHDFLRLQVFLSRNGVCSRRKAMDLIRQGKVSVNGKTAEEPSTPVRPAKDKVCVSGRLIGTKRHEYILFNKPRGVVTTRADRFAPKTVLDFLPKDLRHLHSVGRLDKDTEGLLLLTNDGDLTHHLTHPKYNIDKTYWVKVKGLLISEERRRLEEGTIIEGKRTAPPQLKGIVEKDGMTEFFMTIHEGRKRQIRLMMAQIGHPVIALKRIAQGPLRLGRLKVGCFRRLTAKEIQTMKSII